jgi:4,5:9,10-diseco-3-hydroxy-5,9,17-trioxoandrosta-1(10),2-diene-4-oate hydrolase
MAGLDRESTRRSAKAGDLTLNYYEAGEPTSLGGGLPLVMLHGGGPGASSWSNFGASLPGFAQDFRVLLVDQPGFGDSDKPEVVGNYFRHSAGYLLALLDELGIDRIHLLGNSLGGGTAARFALENPKRVGRLVLMGPGGLNLSVLSADPTEGVKRLMDFSANPSREAMRAFISTMVVDQSLVTDALVDERLADAT